MDSFMFPKKKKKIVIKHPGALHDQLGIPQGKKIPTDTLEKLKNSKNPTTRKRAQFAINAKKFGNGKKG